jgi:hypothetical protein
MINMVLHLKLPVLIPTHLLLALVVALVVVFPVLEGSLVGQQKGKGVEISLNNSSIPFPVRVDHGLGMYRVTIFRLPLQSVS